MNCLFKKNENKQQRGQGCTRIYKSLATVSEPNCLKCLSNLLRRDVMWLNRCTRHSLSCPGEPNARQLMNKDERTPTFVATAE